MKIKKFENFRGFDEIEVFKNIYNENPNKDTHDFYVFLANDEFVKDDDGRYNKVLGIENMVRITPDKESLGAIKGMNLRKSFQHDLSMYHIWLPKDVRKDVEGKGYSSIEPWLLDLIDKHSQNKPDSHGKQVVDDVIDVMKGMNDFNL